MSRWLLVDKMENNHALLLSLPAFTAWQRNAHISGESMISSSKSTSWSKDTLFSGIAVTVGKTGEDTVVPDNTDGDGSVQDDKAGEEICGVSMCQCTC